MKLSAWVDADHASCPDTLRSVSGGAVMSGRGAISWFSRARRITATSTSKSEYVYAFYQHAHFIPIVGVGKERRTLIGPWLSANGSTHYWNYLEEYGPCAGGLSAVNAIGTQLRDPINSALTQWRMAVQINKWTPPRKSRGIPLVSTRFSPSMGNEQADAGRTAELVSRDQILRHVRGQGNIHFPCSADHEHDWQPYPVDPYSAICDDHT